MNRVRMQMRARVLRQWLTADRFPQPPRWLLIVGGTFWIGWVEFLATGWLHNWVPQIGGGMMLVAGLSVVAGLVSDLTDRTRRVRRVRRALDAGRLRRVAMRFPSRSRRESRPMRNRVYAPMACVRGETGYDGRLCWCDACVYPSMPRRRLRWPEDLRVSVTSATHRKTHQLRRPW